MRRSEPPRNAAFMRLPLPGRAGEGWRLSTNARFISAFEAVLFMRFVSARLIIHHSTLYGRTNRVRWRTKREIDVNKFVSRRRMDTAKSRAKSRPSSMAVAALRRFVVIRLSFEHSSRGVGQRCRQLRL